MISVAEDNEFSVIVADIIETIAKVEKFDLLVWVNGSEIAYEFDQHCNFHFMHEGCRVVRDNLIDYIFYDNITTLRVIYEC